MEFQNSDMRVVIGGADGLNMRVPHLHGHYELYYLLEGERLFFIRDKAYPMGPGSLAFLDGEELHRVFSTSDASHRRMVVFFQKEAIENQAVIQMFRTGGCLALNRQERADFERIVERLETELAEENPMRAEAADALTRYLLILSLRAYLSPRTPLRYGGAVISDAVAYISAHYAEPLLLPEVCERFHVSVSHFTSLFKASTGFTFIEYLNHVRIQHAAKLFEESDISVAEVAGAVGFASFSYFSRRFKEIRGMSPMQYRAWIKR